MHVGTLRLPACLISPQPSLLPYDFICCASHIHSLGLSRSHSSGLGWGLAALPPSPPPGSHCSFCPSAHFSCHRPIHALTRSRTHVPPQKGGWSLTTIGCVPAIFVSGWWWWWWCDIKKAGHSFPLFSRPFFFLFATSASFLHLLILLLHLSTSLIPHFHPCNAHFAHSHFAHSHFVCELCYSCSTTNSHFILLLPFLPSSIITIGGFFSVHTSPTLSRHPSIHSSNTFFNPILCHIALNCQPLSHCSCHK